ncbi:hypothetical protein D3C72_935680 [compost metagenome]
MRHAGEQLEAAAVLAVDRLGQQLRGQVAGVEAVAGVGLGVPDVGLVGQAAELRQAVGADADHPAPGVVDAHVGQLREDLEHLRAHVSGDVRRITPGIVAGTAEQQASVRREPVVIEADFLVAHRQIVRDQLRGARLGQRFGGDDVAAGRQHLATELLFEVVQMRIAAEHQTASPHRAVCATHLHGRAMDDFQHFTLLENLHAERRCQPRFALHQIQRMQMTGPHVDQATGIDVGVDHLLAHLLRADQAGFMGIAEFGEVDQFILEGSELRRGVGQIAKAPAQVALDAVVADALTHQFDRIDAGALQVTHAFLTDILGEPRDLMTDPANQLAAIAPTGAPADAPGFDQHHRQPALRQFDGGVDAGEPAADHADIGSQVTVQQRIRCARPGRSGVVRASVFLGVLIHLFDFTLLQDRVIRRMIAWGGVVEM